MAMYRPPFAGYAIRDYSVLMNMLPEYRQAANQWALRSQAAMYASTVRDALVRYSGSLDDIERDARQASQNPIVWLREGTRTVLASPFRLLRSLGILSEATESGIVGSSLLKIGSGVVALLTIAAAVVQILTGWEATIDFVQRLLRR